MADIKPRLFEGRRPASNTYFGRALEAPYLTYNGTIRYISTILNKVYCIYYISTCIVNYISTYVVVLQYLIKYTAICYISTVLNIVYLGRTLEAPIPKMSSLVKKVGPFSKRTNPL